MFKERLLSKKAISAVVATVLIIMITVAAVGIIWVAIIPLVKDNIGDVCRDVDVSIVTSQGYTCYIPRNITVVQVGKGANDINISGLKFYLSALGNSLEYDKETSFSQNDYKVFYLNSTEISELQKISVSPIVQSGNVKKICSSIFIDGIVPCSQGSVTIGSEYGQVNPNEIVNPSNQGNNGGVTSTKDNIYPIFSNYLDNNFNLAGAGVAWFNITIENTNGTVLFEINKTNITATNLSLNVYNVSYNFDSNGTYPYRWYSWGNGTAKNYHVSDTKNYYIWPDFEGGDGSANNPYQITSWAQLNNIRNDLNANYILINNLSSNTEGYFGIGDKWIPIGDCGGDTCGIGNPDHIFAGSFNGNKNIISNLSVVFGSEVGLFGYSSGNFSDVSLEGLDIYGDGSAIGGLVGRQNGGYILNSYTRGVVRGYVYTGGLVGYLAGSTIRGSYSSAEIYGNLDAGGLVGSSSAGLFNNVYATGNVNGSNSIGGLMGGLNGVGILNNSFSIGNVTGITLQTGGLVGYSQGTISNCYSTGNVTSSVAVGGLVGVKKTGTITNSYWYNRSQGFNCWKNTTGGYNFGCIAPTTEDYFKNYDNPPMNLTAGNGWDFINTWKVNSGQYPKLKWQS